MTVLGIDVGTTSMKAGVFEQSGERLELAREASRGYAINTYNDGLCGDIHQDRWVEALFAVCGDLAELMPEVDAVALSGTTPGLTAMDGRGNPLYPAILMLDQRSRKQAAQIISTVGLEEILAQTGNMPAAGGCSLASILWLRDNEPEVYRQTAVFGHSNTYVANWLCGGEAFIDPSSASLTALYNTVRNDLTWNAEIAGAFGLSTERLPKLIPSHQSAGRVRPALARKLGLRKQPPVIIGGNDAVLAAYSAGIRDAGQVINVNGTCEITLVCMPQCHSSTQYNVRAHVLPQRWLTLYVMNAGGKAFEWFHRVFCSEMTPQIFWAEFLPQALDAWLQRDSGLEYVPFLMGSRYSLEPLKAEFRGMTSETTRQELLAALVRGLCTYQRLHLEAIADKVPLSDEIVVTGGAVNDSVVRAKKRWTRDCRYRYREQSSLEGAALLAREFLREPQ